MALPKRIKQGGAYYKGYAMAVASASGEYTQVIEETGGMAINSISVTPGTFGDGDTWKLVHHAGVSGTGSIIAIIAEDMNNMAAGAATMLDFPAAERVDLGESLMLTYLNTASIAGTVYVLVESVGLRKKTA